MKTKKIAAISAGVAGIASLAAGAYFFFGPKGKAHAKQAKAWAIKMKGDVVEKLEQAKDMSEPMYDKIIDTVASEYAKGKRASKEEVADLAKDLKKHWKTISGIAKGKSKSKTTKVK